MALLEVRNVTAGYGDTEILRNVSMQVDAGEMVTIIGPNGAGKSTVMKTVFGLLHPRSGSVHFNGEDISALQPYQIVERGMCYVPQVANIFTELTVVENLEMGAFLSRKADIEARMEHIFEYFPRLKERQHTAAGFMSGGEQQMLTLCRTLMGDPDLAIIDEPTEGLAPKIVAQVGQYLRTLKERGVSVLLIEQKLTIAMDVSDRTLVMGHGSIVFDGTPAQLRSDAAVRKQWLEV